jgi:Mrp family chromosome partitioning ATPase
VVIFDSSPVLSAPDAMVLSAQMDGTILAVHAGSTDRAPVEQAVEQLRKAGAKLVGTVLTRVKASSAGYYGGYHGYYYGYYYGYHGEESDKD